MNEEALFDYLSRHSTDARHPASTIRPDLFKNLDERARREGVKPENYLAYIEMILANYPKARREAARALPDNATAAEKLAFANGDCAPPPPKITPREGARHSNGLTADQVRERQKAEAEAEEERKRLAWNRRHEPWEWRRRRGFPDV
jgi:hypothetical protein